MQTSDSRSVSSILMVQDLLNEAQAADPSKKVCQPISEILDPTTRALMSGMENLSYVLSNQIVSNAMSQIAEARDMNKVISCPFSIQNF